MNEEKKKKSLEILIATQTGCAENKDGCSHQKALEIMALIGDETDRHTDHRCTVMARAASHSQHYLSGDCRKGKPRALLHFANTLPHPHTIFRDTLEEASVTDNGFCSNR